MPDIEIPDEDHVARYCKPKSVSRYGLPTALAFRLRPGETYLSLNWLEYFTEPSHESAIERVQESFHRKKYRLKRNGRFAVLNVGAAKEAVKRVVGRRGEVEQTGSDHDPSHVGLFGYTEDNISVALHLSKLVRRDQVYPAVGQIPRR